jgi:hypothetical protein
VHQVDRQPRSVTPTDSLTRGLSMVVVLRVLRCLAFLLTWPLIAPGGQFGLHTVTPAEAQETVKVWVNTKSGVYHCAGGRYYGTTKAGAFMLEAEARAAGNRPAYGQSCGPSAGPAPAAMPQPLRLAAADTTAVEGTKVWVNTKSSVYHCAGSRYYGNTKAGRFMSELEARAAGNHPAYGRTCS